MAFRCPRSLLLTVLLPGITFTASLPADGQCQVRAMPDPLGQTGYGDTIAVQGSLAAISANRPQALARQVQILERDALGAWVPGERLSNPAPGGLQWFGIQLALDQHTLAVLARTDAFGILGPPAADTLFLFERSTGTFQFTQALDLQLFSDELFVHTYWVDLSGDTLAVGLRNDAVSAEVSHVQIYERSGGQWTAGQTLLPPPNSSQQLTGFGWQVDVAGDWLAVLQGSVGTHILRREAGTWVPFQWLPADPCGADQGVLFARWSGDELLMGLNPAPAHGCGPELRVYRQTSIGAPFELRQTISLPLPPPGLGWGQAAAAEGRLLIGSPTAIYGQAVPKHGTVAVFDRGAANWEQSATLVPSWPVNNHTGMGLSLGLSGDDLFVGCPADNSLAASAGTIHLWRVGDDPCPSLVGVPEARSLGYVNGALGYLPAGRQELLIDAGPAHAGEFYLVLGSLSGTAPGLSIDGQLLPLVFDAWTAHTLANPNVGPLLQTFGTLDAQGRALAALQLPAPLAPVLGGMTLHHAFLALSITPALQVTFASEPAGLFLWP